jgi:O-antigen/teichoic acid export membrane protein
MTLGKRADARGPRLMGFTAVVARNSGVGLVAQLAVKGLSFAFSVLILRNLGAEAYGQYAAVLAFGAMFLFVADLGLSPFLVREVARLRDAPEGKLETEHLYAMVLRLRLCLSLAAAVLLILAAWATGRPPVMVGAIALGTLGLILYGVQGTSDAMLAGLERLDISSAAKVINQLVFVVLGGVALVVGFGYYGLIVANLLGVAAITYLCWRAVRSLNIRPRELGTRPYVNILRASIPFGIITFALGLSYRFDTVLLNITRSDAETGYYNAAYNLVFSAAVLSNVLNTSLYPSLTRKAATSKESLDLAYERVLRYLMIMAFPIAVGAFVLAEEFVGVLYTDSYLPAVPALQVIVWAVPLMFASEFLGYLAVIQRRESRVARAILASTVLNVAVNLILVPAFGLMAAAAVTVVTEAVLLGQYAWILRATLLRLDWQRATTRPLLAAAVMGTLLVLVRGLPLGLDLAIGAATYSTLLLLLRLLGRDELAIMKLWWKPA